MLQPTPVRRVLVIEPDGEIAKQLGKALQQVGVETLVAADAEAGWRLFARERPAMVLTALATPREGGAWFLRRLQTEYMGPLPATYILCSAEEIGADVRALEPDGVIVPPLSARALASLVGGGHQVPDSAERQATRLRELYELSTLGADYLAGLDVLVARTALAFGVSDCVMWGPPHEEHWPRTARPLGGPEEQAVLLARCDLALSAAVTLHLAATTAGSTALVVDEPGHTFLAAPIAPPGGVEIGALCLVDHNAHRFTAEERDALRVLARRLSIEMSWVSAHTRLVEEHEKLRESSLLDPLLGVWTRAALEQALNTEIAVAQRREEPLALAILDIDQLRQINDRYGHLAGDAALAHVSQMVSANVRAQDVIGRFGGDEIAVVLAGTDLAEARNVLEGVVRAVINTPLAHHGIEILVGVAAGVTTLAADETTGEAGFGRAVGALRRARRARATLMVSDPDVKISSSDVEELGELGDNYVLPAGSTLGGMYRIRHEISRGAMGVVYRGEDLGLGRPVAIKVLRSDLAQDDALVARFREEAAMLASVQHPNLVQVYSFGAQGDDVYFVMELVEGEPLSELLRRNEDVAEGIDFAMMAKVVEEIAGALTAMHTVGVIHRDVKPANVLVDPVRDRAVLVDVGVAKKRDDRSDAAGTPGFAAPESFLEAEETAATDVYGLAATTYMMLTGLAPFGSGDVERVVKRQLYDRPAAPSELRRGLPAAIDAVILKALAPDPGARYASAGAFAAALRETLDEASEELTAPGGVRAARQTRPAGAAVGSVAMPGTAPSFTTRRLASPLPPADGAAAGATPSRGHSRGALFRVAYRMLGNRLGSAWVRRMCEGTPELTEVLNPAVSPMSWQPFGQLVTLLGSASAAVRDPVALANSLGRAVMSATFARFFGADPRTLTPAAVLKAAEAYWSRYHTWGRVSVDATAAGATIVVAQSPGEPLVCALVEGSFGRIAELAGARDVSTDHPECVCAGHTACRFVVKWREAAAPG